MPHLTEEIWSSIPGRETRLIVASWPDSDGTHDETQLAFEPIQTAAEVFRRAGVRASLDEEQQRIFDAVVKPDRVKVDGGNVDAEVGRLRGEIARAEGMLANERFVQSAPENVVEAEREKLERYRRELDALGS
jgi:valyl-tRNA synthetase